MLDVVFYRDNRNRLSRIVARGHADAADHGQDIVCAAASAVLQAARLGLAEYAGAELDVHQEPGDFSLSWPEPAHGREAALAIAATAQLAIEQIARQYPQHVRVRCEAAPNGTSGAEAG